MPSTLRRGSSFEVAAVNIWWHKEKSLAQRLAMKWRKGGLVIRAGATPRQLSEFEAKYGVVISDDLREYFATVDGMDDNELDFGDNHFWALSKLRRVEEELAEGHAERFAYAGCFVFVDHLLWCCAWAVRIESYPSELSGPVFQLGSGEPRPPMAPNFRQFLELYLAKPINIL
jgi:hypothetical protein